MVGQENTTVSFIGSSQRSLLEQVDHREISRGATVPNFLILEYLEEFEDPLVLGAGCGIGDKEDSLWSLGKGEIRVVGVDINQKAIEWADKVYGNASAGLDYYTGDITDLELDDEAVQGVVGNGLLCNLVFNQETGEDDLVKAIKEFSRILQPGGYLFLADCLRVDDSRAEELILLDSKVKKLPSGFDFYYWLRSWENRYLQNELLGLQNGIFYVMAPGVGKELEFGNVDQLWNLVLENRVERLARHYEEEFLQDLITSYGFSQIHWEKVVWRSRTDEPTIGIVAVFKKE